MLAAQTREATTWLYVPASRALDLLPKAVASADGVVLDLEDAVHPSHRAAARALVVDALTTAQPVPVAVRVNRVGSDDFRADVATVGPLLEAGRVQCVRLPKVESAAEVEAAWAAIGPFSGVPHLVPLLESALGVRNAHEVAAADGVAALTLGESDLRADLGLPRGDAADEGLLLARLTVVLASRAARLPSPTASVYANVADTDGLRASCVELRRLGFHGRSVIHPRQVAVVREAFAPTDGEIAWAAGVIDRAEDMEDDGLGAAALADGSLVDPAIVRQAVLILQRAAP